MVVSAPFASMKRRAVLKLLRCSQRHSGVFGDIQLRQISLGCTKLFERRPDVQRHMTWSYCHGRGQAPLIGATICESLQKTVEKTPDAEAVVFCESGIRRTFQQLMQEVDQLAAGLHNLGFRKGDRIGIWGPSTLEWVVTQFATARIGAILVNVNPAYQTRELEFALNKTKIKGIISAVTYKTQKYYDMLAELAPELSKCPPMELKSKRLPELRTVIMMGSEKFPGAVAYDDVMEVGTTKDVADVQNISRSLDFDEAINIQFTSGTTGNPKGATLTHHNVINNVRYIGERLGFGDYHHRVLCQVPLYHCFGMVGGPLAMALFGLGVIFPCAGYDPGLTLKAIAEEKTNVVYGTPTMYIDMMAHPEAQKHEFSHLEKGIMAGSSCPAEVVQKFERMFSPVKLMLFVGTVLPHGCRCNDNKKRVSCIGKLPKINIHDLPVETRLLNLRGKSLGTIRRGSFQRFLHMTHLCLQRDGVEWISPDAFVGMGTLTHLRLGNNRIKILLKGAFSGITNLKELDLHQNRIGDIQDFAFQSLGNLLVLNLKSNRLPSLGDDMFTGLSSLKVLRVSNNNIEVISAATLFPLESLKRLYLDGNRLTSVPSKAFSGGVLMRLTELDLSRNRITRVTDKEFASLPALTYLNMEKNQLSWLSDTAFSGLPRLKSLLLNENKLAIIPNMKAFSRLKVFGLGGNRWICNCKMEDFKRWIAHKPFDLVCSAPQAVAGLQLKELDVGSLACD